MVFKPVEKRSGSARNARSTSGHSITREKCVSASHRSGAPVSFVEDAHRCILNAEHKMNCINHQLFEHAQKFVKHATQNKRESCKFNITSMSIQAMGPNLRSNCQHSTVLKRALTCALQFQNIAEEGINGTMLCGHAVRLHNCLKTSVDGTKCLADLSIRAQLKLYRKVLEDQYKVRCDAPSSHSVGEPVSARSREKVQLVRNRNAMKRLKSSALRRYLGKNTHMSKQVATHIGSYDDDEDYELISKRQKPMFASPSGKLVEEPDGFREDDSYDILKPDNYQYRDMSRRNQRELEDYEDFADLEPDMRPRAGRKQRRRHRKLRSKDALGRADVNKLVGKPQGAGRTDREARRAKREKRRKLAYEDEYFFDNEPDEESVLSALPDNMAMFQHIRHRPELNVERLLGGNVSAATSASAAPRAKAAFQKGPSCNGADLQGEVNKCNVTLTKLIALWPKTLTKESAPFSKEVYANTICSDVRSYNACLTFAMQATGCGDRLPTLRGIMQEQERVLGLGICRSGSQLSYSTCTLFSMVLALLTVAFGRK